MVANKIEPIPALDRLIAYLEDKAQRSQARLEEDRRSLDAARLTWENIQRINARPAHHERPVAVGVSVDDLRELSVIDAAVKIAQRNRRVLPVTRARKAMVAAGVLPDGRDGTKALFAALRSSDQFEAIEGRRGQYALLPEVASEHSEGVMQFPQALAR